MALVEHVLDGTDMEESNVNTRWVFGLLLLSIVATANAGWITVDPDDYQPGSQIVSPYMRVADVHGALELPVFASVPGNNPDLPSDGNSVFDFRPVASHFPGTDQMEFGLLFDFASAVDQLQIDVLNFLYRPGLYIDCYAFAADGARITCGGAKGFSVAYGTTSTASLFFDGEGVRKLYVGGGDKMSALYFDNLRFNVPEPGALGLFVLSLLALMPVHRRLNKRC